MNKILNYLTWGFLILFAAPTVMIIASWNSLPGNPLYGIKLGMEQALLVLVSPSFAAQGNLSVKYTERRFSESKQLFASKGSVEGLAYLDKQVVATKDVIVHGNDVKEQAQLAQKYIDTLNDVSQQLAAQQQVIASAPPPTTPVSQAQQTYYPLAQITAVPTPIAYASPAQTPAPKQTQPQPSVQQVSPSPQTIQPPPTQQHQPVAQAPQVPAGATVAQAVAVQQIKQSQETIKETIKELEKVTKKAEQEEKKQEQNQPSSQQPSEQTPNKGGKSGGKD